MKNLVLIIAFSLALAAMTACTFLDHITTKVEPITIGNSSGEKTTVYFRDNNHDELFLSTMGKYNVLWDTTINIAIFYKPVFFKITDDTLHILGNKPNCFRPELTDAKICYHWREGNPLCYEEQAKADGYKIIHSLWRIDDDNQ